MTASASPEWNRLSEEEKRAILLDLHDNPEKKDELLDLALQGDSYASVLILVLAGFRIGVANMPDKSSNSI